VDFSCTDLLSQQQSAQLKSTAIKTLKVVRMAQDSTLPNHSRPENDERARKRIAIGLAPRRPTAKVAPQRPPAESTVAIHQWWPVFLLIAAAAATLLLLAAKVVNSPTSWTPVRQNLTAWLASENSPRATTSPLYRLQIAEDFDTVTSLLSDQAEAAQWQMRVIPQQGVYHMLVWPGHVAWSTLGVHTPAAFKLETALSVRPETPDGYGGLLARYQDPDNFYFFVIDGQHRFQAQLHKAGLLYVLQPWVVLDVLHPPGQNNVIGLTDNGAVMRLYVNHTLVFEVSDAQLPPGQAGVLGGAGYSPAQIDVDWLKLYNVTE